MNVIDHEPQFRHLFEQMKIDIRFKLWIQFRQLWLHDVFI